MHQHGRVQIQDRTCCRADVPASLLMHPSCGRDREFAGFGRPTETYADAHLDKSSIPLDEVKVGSTQGEQYRNPPW
jgi:hypothetical protein